jgi:hypothetical protein
VVTTEVDEDVDDGPPWEVLPRALAVATTEVDKTSMVGSLGVPDLVLHHST